MRSLSSDTTDPLVRPKIPINRFSSTMMSVRGSSSIRPPPPRAVALGAPPSHRHRHRPGPALQPPSRPSCRSQFQVLRTIQSRVWIRSGWASSDHRPLLGRELCVDSPCRARFQVLQKGGKGRTESQDWNRLGWASSDCRPGLAFQTPNCCCGRAQFQVLRNRGKKETVESQVWNRLGWSQRRRGSTMMPLVGTSEVAQGVVSPDGKSKFSRKEHAEQLEEFYSENEFLFVDETWGAPEEAADGERGGEISPSVKEKLSLLLAAGRVQKGSRVLVWGGSAALVQELWVTTTPASVVVAHFSTSVMATVKACNDDVICWLGPVEDLPDSYGPFDSVFLNSVLATAHSPADLLRSVASLCKEGAKIVIGCSQGKQDLAVCKERNPQLILGSLPDAAGLQEMINPLPLNLVELQDDSSFYLATLEVDGTSAIAPHPASRSEEMSSQQRFPIRARGHIVKGFGRGSKQMGIPTANIDPAELSSEFLAFPKGVYFGWARLHGAAELDGGVYKMVMNIGNRPTFADGEGVTVEAHILHDFSGEFYGQELSIIVLGFIRGEMRFSSLGELVQRIKADIATAEKLLDDGQMLQAASDDFFDTK